MFKQSFITPILAPSIVIMIDGLPRNLLPLWHQLFPLNASVQYVQNVIENLVIRYFRFRSTMWLAKIWFHILIEIPLSEFDW